MPDIFVATTGTSGGPGTIGSPYATIQQAQAVASAGDTIQVRAGTYNNTQVNFGVSGTSGNPITVRSYDGRGQAKLYPILSPGSVEPVKIQARSWITLDGLEVHGPSGAETIHITEGASLPDNIVVQNCDIYPDAGDGIKLSHGSNITIKNNRVVGSTAEQGIDLVGCITGLIENNDVSGVSSGEVAIQIKGGSESVTVRRNYVHDCDAGSAAHGIRMGGGTNEGDMKSGPLASEYEIKDSLCEDNLVENVLGYALQAMAAVNTEFRRNWMKDTAAVATNAGRAQMSASTAHSPAWPCGTITYTDNGFSRTSPITNSSGTKIENGTTTDGSDPNGGAVTYGLLPESSARVVMLTTAGLPMIASSGLPMMAP